MRPNVTLTTDFQEQEPSVAILKGVLLSGCPDLRIVDLSHDIPRGDVTEAALFLAAAAPYFPDGTVHLVNVAPGPAPLALQIKNQIIIAPDNGVTSILTEQHPATAAHTITVPESEACQTIFGRDVFAPAAAKLASGTSIADLGPAAENIRSLDLPKPHRPDNRTIQGEIIHINRFGNLITNIHQSLVTGAQVKSVNVGSLPLPRICNNYADVPVGSPLALFGADGLLEIAHNGDNAAKRLELSKGIIVKLTIA
jgi:S-adenosylmethionine hydrolase